MPNTKTSDKSLKALLAALDAAMKREPKVQAEVSTHRALLSLRNAYWRLSCRSVRPTPMSPALIEIRDAYRDVSSFCMALPIRHTPCFLLKEIAMKEPGLDRRHRDVDGQI